MTTRFRSLVASKGVPFPINHLVLGALTIWLMLQLVLLEGVMRPTS